jgi:hypothetical protein
MYFKDASDRLTECVTFARLAATLGVAENTILRARMDTESPNARSAPKGWEGAITKLARKRAGELVKLAEELEG